MNGLERAIAVAGTPSLLGAKVGVSRQTVESWIRRGQPPAELVLRIENALGGIVSRSELRPDIYPAALKRGRPPGSGKRKSLA